MYNENIFDSGNFFSKYKCRIHYMYKNSIEEEIKAILIFFDCYIYIELTENQHINHSKFTAH